MFFVTQSHFGVIEEGFFKGRIYLENKKCVQQGRDYLFCKNILGRGIRCYAWLTEVFTSCLSKSTPVEFLNSIYYIKKRSFTKYIIDKKFESNQLPKDQWDQAAERIRETLITYSERKNLPKLIKLIKACLDCFCLQIQNIFDPSCDNLDDGVVDLDISQIHEEMKSHLDKMWKNSERALTERRISNAKNSLDLPYFYSKGVNFNSKEDFYNKIFSYKFPINLLLQVERLKGLQKNMGNFDFCLKTKEGYLLGVLDGRNNDNVAKYVALKFQKNFYECLKNSDGDVKHAFTKLIASIQEKIFSKKEWSMQGATAVFCYIDRYSHLIFTATIGNCEAKIYRKNSSGLITIIPLSCVRDWTNKKEAQRASIALQNPDIAESWPKAENRNDIYFPLNYNKMGVNVSRAFGHQFLSTWKGRSGVICKPKITINFLKAGDQLIVASDGFWNFVSEELTIMAISRLDKKREFIAKKLLDLAFNKGESSDNITILSAFIHHV